ncbi:Asparagine synthetase [glutamine-hydrolyzing] 1 [Marinobacterium sp. xm-a-121]|uniref:asparagine synthase (glutamine-hydrolyzing) n=1 Tax=unclassified Marinobacterium TaxID=2644139 RepID=UPI001568DBE7|nr:MULTISPECIES: asparagine synthase (glutamine-hydrolyzing) [unclassified Marinobacterium]NRP37549.1 Asparagine synthetase [glutamine-hydrolyzing] 1 [Marinobacterium sp. xm-a-121]NRP99893.1 Asparagine synthetase [glutamine-hydrolyzing] 1 [Marinobacterium sp. xm-v-233]
MCGIFAIASKQPLSVGRALSKALTCMHARGPDDEGAVVFNSSERQVLIGEDTPENVRQHLSSQFSLEDVRKQDYAASVALGHRRLSILDLSPAGHQPMPSDDEKCWVVFNGEIYNFREIRNELLSLGHVFLSKSDTEVILKAYQQWGEDCVLKFNGMFGFCIYDSIKQQLFIARDRVGIKPVYYYHDGDKLVLASDIKTLCASGLVPIEPDVQGLYYNFAFGITPRPRTAFKDILAIRPGHFLKCDLISMELSESCYWDVKTNVQDQNMSFSDAREQLKAHLERAVELRLVADVGVGTFMSGGVDSTLISSIGNKYFSNIKAFTLGFDEKYSEFNELEQASATAKMNGIQHIISIERAETMLEKIQEMVFGFEEPFYSLSPDLILSKTVADHDIKVCLNGLGGDELFAGYNHYKYLKKWERLHYIGRMLSIVPDVHRKIRTAKKLLLGKTSQEFYVKYYSMFEDAELAPLFGENFDSLHEIQRQYLDEDKEFTDDMELMSYLDLKNYIGNHHVHRCDQFTMANSIEGRFPFLDHELIEFAFTVPSKFKLQGSQGKYILRDLARDFIHPNCLAMGKKGFRVPVEYWVSGQLAHLVEEQLAKLKQRDIFSAQAIDDISKNGTVYQKWHMVMTNMWFESFIDQQKFV